MIHNPTLRGRKLETVSITTTESHVPLFEHVLTSVCGTVAFFEANKEGTLWRVEGVKEAGADNDRLHASLCLAEALTGETVTLHRQALPTTGWLARNRQDFKPLKIGRHFLIRPSHDHTSDKTRRICLTLDAGMAFGSGEHATTKGCLQALEFIAPHRPHHILDMGCGSGILAMAAAKWLHRHVLAADIDPWAVRACRENLILNRLNRRVHVVQSNGWHNPIIARRGPYDLIFANILARPLCLMASQLARNLTLGGYAVLSGLLRKQVPMVLSAYRRASLVLVRKITDGEWATLILKAPSY